jgi:hypothetical protein
MNTLISLEKTKRLTQHQKEQNDFEWYKYHLDMLDARGLNSGNAFSFENPVDDEYANMKVNYDLVNNIINLRDFEYVCKPYGAKSGELPAQLTNRDIISGKIKVLLGMEAKRPFGWKVVAVNEEATTRKEQEKFGRIKQFTLDQIMMPIRQRIEQQAMEQTKGRQLTEQEQQQLQQQIEQQVSSQTPEEVMNYMKRDHQDPAEALAHQLLEYLVQKENIRNKFNKGWKHYLVGGKEIYWCGIIRDEPVLKVINPLRFAHDKAPDLDYIEDGMWAMAEYRLTPADVTRIFDLTDTEVEDLMGDYPFGGDPQRMQSFTFTDNSEDEGYTIRVIHGEWISERKIGWLSYMDPETGKPETMPVPEQYKLNKEHGDISIEWTWIPEKHEGYKIGRDLYKEMRPVPWQHTDPSKLYDTKLSYMGACCDNINSRTTSPVDRMKAYQYFYNILMYRIELLIASDKGRHLAVNLNMIPTSAGIDVNKFMYFMEANKLIFLNPNEEGNRSGSDISTATKEIDMSLASDIANYIKLAEYIQMQCGNSVGITQQMEGQIGPNDAVNNTRQSLMQSSHILEPYFEQHNIVKRNVLTQLLEVAKVAYSKNKTKALSYVLDDLSMQMLNLDSELLSNSTYGLFVSDSTRAFETKQMIEQLAQAAMQNQAIDLSAVIKVLRSENVQQAEEMLEVAEDKKAQQNQQAEAQRQQAQKEMQAEMIAHEKEKWNHEKDMIITKEAERRETELQKQAMLSVGFNENKDADDDGQLDVIEIYKEGEKAKLDVRKQALEEQKFQHQQKVDQEQLKLKEKEIKVKGKSKK